MSSTTIQGGRGCNIITDIVLCGIEIYDTSLSYTLLNWKLFISLTVYTMYTINLTCRQIDFFVVVFVSLSCRPQSRLIIASLSTKES